MGQQALTPALSQWAREQHRLSREIRGFKAQGPLSRTEEGEPPSPAEAAFGAASDDEGEEEPSGTAFSH